MTLIPSRCLPARGPTRVEHRAPLLREAPAVATDVDPQAPTAPSQPPLPPSPPNGRSSPPLLPTARGEEQDEWGVECTLTAPRLRPSTYPALLCEYGRKSAPSHAVTGEKPRWEPAHGCPPSPLPFSLDGTALALRPQQSRDMPPSVFRHRELVARIGGPGR